MFAGLIELFKSKAVKDAERTEAIRIAAKAFLEEEKEKERAAAIEEAKRIHEMKEAAIQADKEKDLLLKSGSEPWFKIESIEIGDNGKIAVKFDWNHAFIKYLRDDCNFEGDEDRIIQQYTGVLLKQFYEDRNDDALDILKQPGFEDESLYNDKKKEDLN